MHLDARLVSSYQKMHDNANLSLPTRWSLLNRLKDWDDQESWRQFFEAYWQLIYNTASKAGLNHAEAQEVVQEVVISVAKKMGEFNTDPARGSFKSWLLNITRWRITDQLRKRAREQAVRASPTIDATSTRTDTIDRIADPAGSHLEAAWNAEWKNNLLQVALERVKTRVKPEMFQIFDLVMSKHWSALKVSRRLKVSLTQVYYARCKVSALAKLEIKRLEKNGI
jgi:RNA polymerase sigma factor (sigma-70 family)